LQLFAIALAATSAGACSVDHNFCDAYQLRVCVALCSADAAINRRLLQDSGCGINQPIVVLYGGEKLDAHLITDNIPPLPKFGTTFEEQAARTQHTSVWDPCVKQLTEVCTHVANLPTLELDLLLLTLAVHGLQIVLATCRSL
jgi:hypothetical protein